MISTHQKKQKPCKRGHSPDRRRLNSQGNPVCRDCHEIANQKYRRNVGYARKESP